MKTIGLFKNRDGRRVLCWPSMLLFLVLALTLPALSGWAISIHPPALETLRCEPRCSFWLRGWHSHPPAHGLTTR